MLLTSVMPQTFFLIFVVFLGTGFCTPAPQPKAKPNPKPLPPYLPNSWNYGMGRTPVRKLPLKVNYGGSESDQLPRMTMPIGFVPYWQRPGYRWPQAAVVGEHGLKKKE